MLEVGDNVTLVESYDGKIQKYWTGKVVCVFDNILAGDDKPLVRIERMDLDSHKRENWAQMWLIKRNNMG